MALTCEETGCTTTQARDAGKTVEEYERGLRQEARRYLREQERLYQEEVQAAKARDEDPPPRPKPDAAFLAAQKKAAERGRKRTLRRSSGVSGTLASKLASRRASLASSIRSGESCGVVGAVCGVVQKFRNTRREGVYGVMVTRCLLCGMLWHMDDRVHVSNGVHPDHGGGIRI